MTGRIVRVLLALLALEAAYLVVPVASSAALVAVACREDAPIQALRRVTVYDAAWAATMPREPMHEETVHPVATAQAGLAYLAEGDTANARAMLDLLRPDTLLAYRFDYLAWDIPLEAPWYSAMAQGQALSLADRWAQTLLDPSMQMIHDGHTWLREYPDPAPPVWNGNVFALLGLVDYADWTGDPDAWRVAGEAVAAARAGVPVISRPGTFQRYDVEGRSTADAWYVEVHQRLVDALAAMTDDGCFRAAAIAWRLDVLPPN